MFAVALHVIVDPLQFCRIDRHVDPHERGVVVDRMAAIGGTLSEKNEREQKNGQRIKFHRNGTFDREEKITKVN